jgi:thiamine biosynthesis lipoprotein
MATVAVARNAMATRFEIVLHGDNPSTLRAMGEEVLDEIDRLENQLSLFRPQSEIARVNALAARVPVRVSPVIFRLLEHAIRLSRETGGAFDITVSPLMQCWGFRDGDGSIPSPDALAEARANVGSHLIDLNPSNSSVQFARDGVKLDLGAIGKGYALDRAAEILRDAGATSALLNGGTSTVIAIGHPPIEDHWKIAIERPARPNAPGELLVTVPLKDESLSVSAAWGKSFIANGQLLGHVLDPRTGHPAIGVTLAAVVLSSATETDALSTALLVAGRDSHDSIASLRPGMKTLVAGETEPGSPSWRKGHGIACS